MFDFVRDIIAGDDVGAIDDVIDEMKGLIKLAKSRREEITKNWENDEED